MLPLLTIFTPTFNRKKLLKNLYYSLQNQTSYNFCWMIIDDGSTDNTEQIVNQWINECTCFKIEYYKKENGGLQSGYVEAIKHLKTELAMCIDSDDCAMPNAVELVENAWNNCDQNKYAGLFGLDCFSNGTILGGRFDTKQKTVDIIKVDVGIEKRTPPDRALVVRSDLYRNTKPAKRYPGERTMNATYLHLQIGMEYPFVVLNEPLIQVEYQVGGLTHTKKNHYFSAPNTFADWRLFCLSIPRAPKKYYIKNQLHYIAECIIAKRKGIIKDSPRKIETCFLFPFGFLLWIYLKYATRKENK